MLKGIPLHLKYPLFGFKMPLQSLQICKRQSEVGVLGKGSKVVKLTKLTAILRVLVILDFISVFYYATPIALCNR
jgi:hypothetical protein